MSDIIIDQNVLNELVTSTGGDKEFLKELVDTYLTDSPKLLAQMRDALSANDVDAFRRAAHSLKSTSANFGALTLSARAKELEMMAKAGTLEGAREKMPQVETDYAKVKEELRKSAQ
jgi:HPt (histidine-containing phosphotransfer) domain-containing protein